MSDFQLFIDLIKSGSDQEIEYKFKIEYLEKTDKESWRPLHHACRYGRVGLVKLLLSHRCILDSRTNREYQPIHLACENGHIDIMKILIENKCDINTSDKNGYQPIHLACENNHIDIVKLLIANKFNIDASDKLGYQPIHLACKNGNIDIVKILIEKKCDINACNNKTFLPIHLACMHGHIDIVNILIANKCNINASNNRKYQPIHFACMIGHIDIVKILLANNCDINALTEDGQSPIDIATQKRHQQIIKILNGNLIESIANAMDLQCSINCDHKFCRQTMNRGIFNKGESITRRNFTKVYKYRKSNTNVDIVIKKARYDCEDDKNIERNINKYSSQISHKNIVRYFGSLEKSGKRYIFMEFIPGGSIKDLIDKRGMIEISKVIQYSKQILVGLKFLHSKSIIHRDIKPGNILLDYDGTVKLTDFGISKSLKKTFSTSIKQAETFCGTPNYMAPEIILGELYDFPSDIWSTGATIIHMITGKMPYYSLQPQAVIFKIGITKKIEFTPSQPISETMQSFINDLLTPEQLMRPSADSLSNHSIFESMR